MITIKNLTFAYGKKSPVLQDFSLDFQQGNIYGLLGKNGTGKSTLLYLIMGLLHAQKGEALVDGMSAKDRNPELMRKMFLLPEEYDLPAVHLSAYVCAIAPFYPNFSMELMEKCLSCFEMSSDVNLGSLSMGQKKNSTQLSSHTGPLFSMATALTWSSLTSNRMAIALSEYAIWKPAVGLYGNSAQFTQPISCFSREESALCRASSERDSTPAM